MKVKKAFALFDIHFLEKKKTGISEMLHKRQALIVAIEGIYSHYHHGNEVINQAALCSSLFINWHLPLPHTVPLGICTTMVNALKDKFEIVHFNINCHKNNTFWCCQCWIFFFFKQHINYPH